MNNYNLFQKRLETSDIQSKDGLISKKVNTFKKALKSAYNSESFEFNENRFLALVSEIDRVNKIEKKRFATLLDYECKVGDIVKWVRNDNDWMITERYDTEVAIFSGEISLAQYELKWRDEETGRIYSSKAATAGPTQLKISENEKKYISYDLNTDTLSLILPKNIEGIKLLKRYGTFLLNNKKWTITVIDDITKKDLITVSAKETQINTELDDIENNLVNGKIPITFDLISSLDEISEIQVGADILFTGSLYRNNEQVDSSNYKFYLTNCSIENNIISFRTLGSAIITVYYPVYDISFSFNLNIVGDYSEIENKIILGNSETKVMTFQSYRAINYKNGSEVLMNGTWSFNNEYADIISETESELHLKMKNNIGSFVLTFTTSELEVLSKNIKVNSIFGGG